MGLETDAAVQDQESNPPASAAAVPVEKESESDMAKTPVSLSEPAPSWFTPKRYSLYFPFLLNECGNSSNFSVSFFCSDAKLGDYSNWVCLCC